MTLRRGIIGLVWAMLALLPAAPSFGQAGEACGSSQVLLFHCTFDGGAKQVGLCLSDGMVSYEFGSDFVEPELTLVRDLAAVDYTPFAFASRTVFESVALMNGDTRYEVYSSTARGPYDGVTKGGITVTFPNGRRQMLDCDAGSVWPRDPLAGIGALDAVIPP